MINDELYNFVLRFINDNNIKLPDNFDSEFENITTFKKLDHMGKAILFARVSTIHQDLVQQIQELRNEAIRLGYNDDDIITIEHKESGISLDSEERLGIQELKKAINENDIDCVIVYEISRISRRPKVLYEVRDWLIERTINLVCIKPYMRLLEDGKLSQTANILFSLFGSISESEMMIKKERMNRGKYFKRANNGYIGGGVIYGYKFVDDKLCVDEDKAKVVRYIFDEYSNGRSLLDLSHELVDRGLTYTTKYNSAASFIHDILKRIEYTGLKLENRYHYPQIITQEQYDRAQAMKTKRKLYTKTSFTYWCKGLLKDKRTGMLISGHHNKGKYEKTDINNNLNISINIDFIDSLTWFLVKERLTKSGPEQKEKERLYLSDKLNETEERLKAIETKIQQLNESIDRANERIVMGKLSAAKGDNLISQIVREIEDCEDKQNSLESEKTEFMNRIIYVSSFLYEPDYYESIDNDEDIYKIIKSNIKEILLEKDEKKYYNHLEYIFVDGSTMNLLAYKSQKKYWVKNKDVEIVFPFIKRTKKRKV